MPCFLVYFEIYFIMDLYILDFYLWGSFEAIRKGGFHRECSHFFLLGDCRAFQSNFILCLGYYRWFRWSSGTDAKPMRTLLPENYNIKCRHLPSQEKCGLKRSAVNIHLFWFQLRLRFYVVGPAVMDVVSRPSACFLLSSQVTRSWGPKFGAILSGWNSKSNIHWDLWVPVLSTFRVLNNLRLLDT